jgi:hypothetical protein
MFYPHPFHWWSTNIEIYFQSHHNHLNLFSNPCMTLHKEQSLSKKDALFVWNKQNENLPLCHRMYCFYIVK